MATILAPYTPAMRLGQGFNSYTHEICINDAVVIDKENPAGDHFAKDSGQVSQIVTYSTRHVDKVSQVTDAMNVSAALSIKSPSFGVGASGSYVDTNKFKESNINYFVQVKVTNQVIMASDVTKFQDIPGLVTDREFTAVFGDCFISGFIEGGELDAIISIKTESQTAERSIKAGLEAHFGKGGVGGSLDVKFGMDHNKNLEASETSITVNWNGGGKIKPENTLWSIDSLTQAAADFPLRVSETPQRSFAILTKYDKLRSFQLARPKFSPLNYEMVDLYTNDLLDLYTDYVYLWKGLHMDFVALEFGKIRLIESKWKPENGEDKQPGKRRPELEEIIKHWEDKPDESNEQELAYLRSFLKQQAGSNHDNQVYKPTIDGLMKAKKDCRTEMLKIVGEVEIVTNNPKLALDPDRDCKALNPAIFRKLLPVREEINQHVGHRVRVHLYNAKKHLPDPVQAWVDGVDTPKVASRRQLSEYAGDWNSNSALHLENNWAAIEKGEADIHVINKFEVWISGGHVCGIRLSYEKDNPPALTYGTIQVDAPRTYNVPAGEKIARVYLHAAKNEGSQARLVYGFSIFSEKATQPAFIGAATTEVEPEIIDANRPSSKWSFRGLWAQINKTGNIIETAGAVWGLDPGHESLQQSSAPAASNTPQTNSIAPGR